MEVKGIGAALACFLSVAAAAAQTTAPDASPESAKPTAADLVSSTLEKDIDTASFYELAAWCQELRLEDSGSRKDLQTRLYAHFKIVPQPAQAAKGRTISVRSAKESEYFTIEEMDQKYISLRGNVVVVLTDTESGTVQEIHAQSIIYNQTLNVVTAKGGVEYITDKKGTKETFTGESLSFDVNTWEGTFFDGRSVRPQKRSGQDVNFYFDGDTMTRLENDTVVMTDGGFTSCDIPETPHYQIRATRVWILAPGEWALENAVMFVGRIPVFYFPFFFYPGDEMFFNPSLGYDEVKGQYVQTTTYLLGKKKKKEGDSSSFSFLQLQGDSDKDYDLELNGLFLRKVSRESGAAEKPDTNTLKLLLDGYSRLGVFLGLAGDFSPLATFSLGIAESRTIFKNGSDYTPYFILGDGTEASYWNQSYIFGLPVPFRYGLSGGLKHSFDFGSVSSQFEYYSDPSFTSDFYSRSEGMQLTSNLESLIAPSETANTKTNLAWDAGSSLDFSRLVKTPLLQTLSVSSIGLKLNWSSRAAPTTTGTPEASDPGRYFYYPVNFIAQISSASIRGEIFRISSTRAPQTSAAQPAPGTTAPEAPKADPGKGFRPPLVPQPPEAKAPESAKRDRFAFMIPQRKRDEAVSGQAMENSVSLTYQTTGRAGLEQSFDTSGWISREDVDFDVLYRTFDTGGTNQILSSFSLWNRLLSGSLSFDADASYRMRFDPAASLASATWQNLLLGDLKANTVNMKSTFQAALNPLNFAPLFSATNLAYKLTLKLYGMSLSGPDPLNPLVVQTFPAWSKDSITDHSVSTALSFKDSDISSTLAFSAQLPPRDSSLTGSLDLGLWMFSMHAQTGATQTAGTWLLNPLICRETLTLTKDITATEELQFDLNNPALEKSISRLKLWELNAGFTMQNMIPTNGLGAPQGGTEYFVPSSMNLGYSKTVDTMWLWKNRIKLDGSLTATWTQNLQKYIESSLDMSFTLKATIFRFLELSLTESSYNTNLFRYVPSWAEGLGTPWVNPIWDLARSFNFFNLTDRYASYFKMRSIDLSAVFHFHDWDVSFKYQGSPILKTVTGVSQYEWTPAFSIQVKWTAVPEITARIYQNTAGTFYMRE